MPVGAASCRDRAIAGGSGILPRSGVCRWERHPAAIGRMPVGAASCRDRAVGTHDTLYVAAGSRSHHPSGTSRLEAAPTSSDVRRQSGCTSRLEAAPTSSDVRRQFGCTSRLEAAPTGPVGSFPASCPAK